jgi:uncharacterized membrane protein YoaK (UPF0700 family)
MTLASLLAASFLLCCNAGYINVLTLRSYYHTASAHVTGLVARVGAASTVPMTILMIIMIIS